MRFDHDADMIARCPDDFEVPVNMFAPAKVPVQDWIDYRRLTAKEHDGPFVRRRLVMMYDAPNIFSHLLPQLMVCRRMEILAEPAPGFAGHPEQTLPLLPGRKLK